MSALSTSALNDIIHRLRHNIYQDDQAGHEERRADVEALSHELGLAQDTVDHLVTDLAHEVNGPTVMGEPVLPHPDDAAVDRFADALKSKLAVAPTKGRGGWGAAEIPCVLPAVFAELHRATAKFPTWPTDPLHAVGVLGEEFGELTKAVMQATYEPHKNGPGAVREEAIQTAAMALRFLLSLDRYQYAGSVQHQQAQP